MTEKPKLLEVEAFLAHLAVEQHVAAPTQNQALSVLLFYYSEVLNQPVEWVDGCRLGTVKN
jgi:hypothetical protein